MKNYYELLEVHETASAEVIEKAYKVLAKRYHPDVQPRDKVFWAESEFKKISEAYQVLSDPERRIVYDFDNGFAGGKVSYEAKYNDLYSEKERLEEELDALKNQPVYNKRRGRGGSGSPFHGFGNITSNIQDAARGIYNETSSSNENRSKNLKAILLTIVIMSVLLFIFWNVPFIRNFLFP